MKRRRLLDEIATYRANSRVTINANRQYSVDLSGMKIRRRSGYESVSVSRDFREFVEAFAGAASRITKENNQINGKVL